MNLSPTIKYVLDFAKTRLSQKIKDRIYVSPSTNIYRSTLIKKYYSHLQLFESQSELHKNIDPKVLPKEYGGDMPVSEMVALWKMELAEKRDRLLSYDRIQLLSDKGIVRRSNNVQINDDLGLQGSFRRLEVD